MLGQGIYEIVSGFRTLTCFVPDFIFSFAGA